MGVDIMAVIDHNLSAKEAIDIPLLIQKAMSGIKGKYPDYFSPRRVEKFAGWECLKPITEEILQQLWTQFENGGEDGSTKGHDQRIEFAYGNVEVYRKTVVVSHGSYHKHGNIFHAKASLEILNINREIARILGSSQILYIPDSALPTSLLFDFPFEGWSVAQIIRRGVADFGPPPPDINSGRANYFFVDDLKQSLDSLQPFEELPEYWRYDETLGKYVQSARL